MKWRAGMLVLAVAGWNASFLVLRATGTWAPFVITGCTLAGLWLGFDSQARRALRFTKASWLVGAAGAALMVAATYLLYPAIALVPGVPGELLRLYGWMEAWRLPSVTHALLVGAVVVSEEVLFRGASLESEPRARVWRGLQVPRARDWGALLLLAALYASAHLASASVLLVCVAFFCGLYWGLVRFVSRSVVAAAIAHLAWDAAVLLVAPLE
jgi:membrane protease YdiL (CAAX protease family)